MKTKKKMAEEVYREVEMAYDKQASKVPLPPILSRPTKESGKKFVQIHGCCQ